MKVNEKPHKLQPGGPGYELVYGCTAIPIYLRTLSPSQDLNEAWTLIAEHEQSLVKPLLTYLKSKYSRGVRIVGPEEANLSRVPTISFVVVGERAIASQDVVKVFDQKGNVSAGTAASKKALTPFCSDWNPLWPFLRIHVGG